MAHFRGTIRGSHGEASRLGGKASGLTVTANGWDAGVKVYASVSDAGEDEFQVVQTGGSNGGQEREIARIIGGRLFLVTQDGGYVPAQGAGV